VDSTMQFLQSIDTITKSSRVPCRWSNHRVGPC